MYSDDRNLISRALGGERDAFAELVDRYRDAVCGVAYHYLGNFDDVQDVAQEAFLQAYSRLDQLREPEKFGPWVRQLTANLCVDILRSRSKSRVQLDQVEEYAGSDDDQRKAAMRLVVREALDKLSEKTRLTVTLCYINGYSHDEVAQFLEVPLNTVRSRLRIAKKQLREEMIEMVYDVLHEDKPGDELTRRIVSIMREEMKAQKSGELRDCLRCIDEMIALLESTNADVRPEQYRQALIEAVKKLGMQPQEEAEVLKHVGSMGIDNFDLRLKAELLMGRADLLIQMQDSAEAAKCYCQSARLAEQLHDEKTRAEALIRSSITFERGSQEAIDTLTEAVDAFERHGDTRGVARSACDLGIQYISLKDTTSAVPLLHKAHDIYNSIRWTEAAVMCGAVIDLVDVIGGELLTDIRAWLAGCIAIGSKRGSLSGTDPSTAGYSWREQPVSLVPNSSLHILKCLGTFLRSDMTVGSHWTNSALAGFRDPARTAVDVTGIESIDVPAGTFSDCIVVRYVTTRKHPGVAVQEVFLGTRRAWYAPGVGLVQLHAGTDDGREGLLQLHDYHIEKPSKDYLPLAIGNYWTYCWPDVAAGLKAREVYRVVESENEQWYLENYHYVYEE